MCTWASFRCKSQVCSHYSIQIMTTEHSTALTRDEQFKLEELMLQPSEGNWVNTFARLLRASDPVNKARLMEAFPELVERFGPGSKPSLDYLAQVPDLARLMVTRTYD
jgi:hypothetical protein